MISKYVIIEFLYFIGASLLIITGLLLKLLSPLGVGLYLLYSGRQFKSSDNGESPGKKEKYIKSGLFWNMLFLGLSSIFYFSIIKDILNILFRDKIIMQNNIILLISVLGVFYFEILFRISLQKKNRFAAILVLIILITSAGSLILGEHWLKTDLILGFLSLTVTVIISFRKAYLELAGILS